MALKEISIKLEYSSDVDNIAKEFVQPCLSNSTQYCRLTGYFSSSIYLLIFPALKEFIANGGLIRLICSPVLSGIDADAIQEGYNYRDDDDWVVSLNNEILTLFKSRFLNKPTKLLACLVGLKLVEIKIVNMVSSSNPSIKRLFHEKVGIFRDNEGTSVVFRGSMNETHKGLSPKGNIESISVYTNAEDNNDRKRVVEALNHFDDLWENRVEGIEVSDFPASSLELLTKEYEDTDWESLLDQILDEQKSRWRLSKPGLDITPRKHQLESLDNWFDNGRRGIFEHATGSGKTITALMAIEDSLNENEIPFVVVPSIELLRQWKKEIVKLLPDDTLVFVCGGNNELWKDQHGLNVWSRPMEGKKCIILSTIDTASSDLFLQNIHQGDHLFLVADEVHRMGSKVYSKIMDLITGARLGLSATPRRFGDPKGTACIFDYFGGIIQPTYTIQQAIEDGVLTKYFYYPQPVHLTDSEQVQWSEISARIKRQYAIESSNNDTNIVISDNLKMLLIKRARIAKKASAKVQLALDVITEQYKHGQRWMIYCEDTDQLRQITTLLNQKNLDAFEYHSDMEGDRDATMTYFKVAGGIIVSVKCLDEGVDIPDATHALILASSTNPREYIQRRGRILRLSANKTFAYLYDAVVLPNNYDAADADDILLHELSRCVQFGQGASNPKCITDLKLLCVQHGIDIKKLAMGGLENE